jgi:hypothetical protein
MGSFTKATREKAKAKICLAGPSGSGKSYTSLILAHAMRDAGLGSKIAVIESEAGKMNKYAGYSVAGQKWDFDICVLDNFGPGDYVAKLEEAHRLGYDIVVIDSISHEWQGKGGALETVDKTAPGKSKFSEGWRTVTPLHNRFVDTVLRLPVHVIATCRLKMGYVLEEETKPDGKVISRPKKIGMEPVQRNGIEYEFEIFATMDPSHIFRVEKTICPALDGVTAVCPGPEFFQPLFTWLNEGVEVAASGYKSSMVPPEKLAEVMTKLREIGAPMAVEKEWILKKFGVEEFGYLSPEQFVKYVERVGLLEYSARQATEKINGQPAATSAPTPAPTAAATNGNGQQHSPAASDNGNQTLEEALATNLPFHKRPLPEQAPFSYGKDTPSRCRGLYQDICMTMGLTDEQAAEAFRTQILPKFNVSSAKELTEAQLKELEQALMGRLRRLYVEKGMEDALTF